MSIGVRVWHFLRRFRRLIRGFYYYMFYNIEHSNTPPCLAMLCLCISLPCLLCVLCIPTPLLRTADPCRCYSFLCYAFALHIIATQLFAFALRYNAMHLFAFALPCNAPPSPCFTVPIKAYPNNAFAVLCQPRLCRCADSPVSATPLLFYSYPSYALADQISAHVKRPLPLLRH